MPDDRILALCELSNDLLFGKIPPSKIAYYIDNSLEAGFAAANELSGSISELYAERGIEIRYNRKKNTSFGVGLRAQATMSKDGYILDIYEESIEELAKHGEWNGNTLSREQALEIHLAHEFFHFQGYDSGEFVSEKLDSVVTLKLFAYERKAKINRASEIAAHMFAKTFLRLPVLPNYFDYLYLIKTGKMTKAQFDCKLQKLMGMLVR